MWPRVIEILIACWLAASPFVFGHFEQSRSLWLNDFICAVLIAACALLSFSKRWRRMHLVELMVAAWLLGFGYLASSEPLPDLQNNILVALVVMMIAIIPSEANQPPRAWREFST
jgi:SPW repeat